MRVLIVEDELYLAEAMKSGLRLEAIAADVVGDGDTALERLSVNEYDAVILDRDIPGIHGAEVARRIIAEGLPCRILMLTAADQLDQKVRGFELGADDSMTKPFELRELVMRLRALARRPAEAGRRSRSFSGSGSIRSVVRSTATAATSRSPASSSRCSRC